MSSYLRLLKFSVIGLAALTGLTACHPTYVRESYQETHVPAYRYPSAPAYSVQYYSTAPTYVERRTVVVPRVVVNQSRVGTLPHVVHSDGHRPHHGPDHVGINPRQIQVAQQSRNVVSQPATSRPTERDHRRERGADRKGQRGNTD
jgi:hypothetical protein